MTIKYKSLPGNMPKGYLQEDNSDDNIVILLLFFLVHLIPSAQSGPQL